MVLAHAPDADDNGIERLVTHRCSGLTGMTNDEARMTNEICMFE
jgi:hypothetical protein